jgi:endonuclease/exonuclease/phosphatase family metal-dependent hydrolase
MPDYFIAFWNLENLFDVEGAERPAWLANQLKKELRGWDETILNTKIAQLCQVIMGMNGGAGPDILGVCEVENRPVLQKLTKALRSHGRRYGIAHADTKDERGIDVAFFFDTSKFRAVRTFSHAILKRTATRDLFQANLHVLGSGRELMVVGNHWPSRSGGRFESEPYRMTAGETLSYWHKRIFEEKGARAPVITMGDFNDEPFDRSLIEYALATYDREKVLQADVPRFFNLMWPLLGRRLGTHYFDNFATMLDQFMVSRGMLQAGAVFSVLEDTVTIERPAGMVSGGAYPSPIRFGRPSAGLNLRGFSDHYPISMTIREA